MNLKKLIVTGLACTLAVQVSLVQAAVNNGNNNGSVAKQVQQMIKDNRNADSKIAIGNGKNQQGATAQNAITDIRYSKSNDKVRIVFNLPDNTQYNVQQKDNGDVLVDFSSPIVAQYLTGLSVNDSTVPFVEIYSDDKMSSAVIKVTDSSAYEKGELSNPRRLYIDIDKNYEYSITKNLEPGLTQISYYSKQSGVKETAYLVDIDPQYFKFAPVLGGGNVMAKNSVRAMANYAGASVAENASYFGSGKELYGVTKIAGDLVSSMYLTRSAFGILADGSPYIGDVSYTAIVHSDKGDLYAGGLNGTRSGDGVMLYNKYYGSSTGTDNTGMEYTIKDGTVVDIRNGNSPLKDGALVISATGSAKETLAGIKIGDAVDVEQILNQPWDTATDILGVGPRLVKDGQVDVTSAQEQIGPDVTGAKAPRTAVGILRSGHILFAVLDGRQSHSKGMMLDEFADFLIGMDVVDAVNFDGGGSSELVINGKIINSPSDGMERPVATALVAIRK